jgi:MFS family permease
MKPELRARGIASFTLITSLPSTFTPYLGGLLMRNFGISSGLRIAYFISGLFGLIGVSYRALKLKETSPKVQTDKTKTISCLISNFIADNVYILRNASDGVKKLLIYSVMVSIATGMTVPYTSLYVFNSLELQPELYGLITNFIGIISVLLLIPATIMTEKVGLKKSAIYASISLPVKQLIFVRAKGMNDLLTWGFIGSASNALLGPSLTALQANLSTQETRGRIMAIFSVFPLTAAIPAQILGGYLYESFGQQVPFLASIPIFALTTIVLAKIRGTDILKN